MRTRAAQCLVLAPNVELGDDDGRLDGLLAAVLCQVRDNATPVVYALSRKKLAQARARVLPLAAIQGPYWHASLSGAAGRRTARGC